MKKSIFNLSITPCSNAGSGADDEPCEVHQLAENRLWKCCGRKSCLAENPTGMASILPVLGGDGPISASFNVNKLEGAENS